MSEKKLISTKILECSTFFEAAYEFKDPIDVMVCHRILFALLLKADDYGRGKVILPVIKADALLSVPQIFATYPDEKIRKFLKFYEKKGVIVIYQTENDSGEYYAFKKWKDYQSSFYRPKKSVIPAPPGEEEEDEKERGIKEIEKIKNTLAEKKKIKN